MTARKLARIFLILGGLVIVPLGITAGFAILSMTESVSLDECPESLEDLIAGWSELDEIPGVLLHIEKNGAIQYSGASGSLDGNGDMPLTPEVYFHIASIGKLFTSATILRLAERGRLDLDAPITRYLDPNITDRLLVIDGIDYTGRITVRQLLTHRSGLGNTDDDLSFILSLLIFRQKSWSPPELIDLARRVEPAGKPGEQTSYSSPGYFLLGLMIEKLTGRPYHAVVRSEIFDRLGMSHTFESTHEWHNQGTTLHHYAGWFDMTENDPSFEFADGGFVSTAKDLAIFGNALIERELFENPGTAELFISPPPGVEAGSFYQGHGPWITGPEDQPMQIFHAGYWGCYLVMVPDTGQVAVMAMGQSAADTWKFWGQVREIIW